MNKEGSAPTGAKEIVIGMLEARQKLTHLVGTAHYNNKRYVLTVHGKEYGAIVGPEDLAKLREIEHLGAADTTKFGTLDKVA